MVPFQNNIDLSPTEEKFLLTFVKKSPLRVFQELNKALNKEGFMLCIDTLPKSKEGA